MIAEVKRGRCSLNGPWKDLDNLDYALGAIGFRSDVDDVSKSLQHTGSYLDGDHRVRLFAIGRSSDENLPKGVAQIMWDRVAVFIYERFRTKRYMKADHDQWDLYGKKLFALAIQAESDNRAFVRAVVDRFEEK